MHLRDDGREFASHWLTENFDRPRFANRRSTCTSVTCDRSSREAFSDYATLTAKCRPSAASDQPASCKALDYPHREKGWIPVLHGPIWRPTFERQRARAVAAYEDAVLGIAAHRPTVTQALQLALAADPGLRRRARPEGPRQRHPRPRGDAAGRGAGPRRRARLPRRPPAAATTSATLVAALGEAREGRFFAAADRLEARARRGAARLPLRQGGACPALHARRRERHARGDQRDAEALDRGQAGLRLPARAAMPSRSRSAAPSRWRRSRAGARARSSPRTPGASTR